MEPFIRYFSFLTSLHHAREENDIMMPAGPLRIPDACSVFMHDSPSALRGRTETEIEGQRSGYPTDLEVEWEAYYDGAPLLG